MQRIKILGGELTSDQWTALAELNSRFTPSAPLQLTTRQDIEFHNVTADNVPLLQDELAKNGLTGLGACGDTLRNITLCPGNGLCQDKVDFSGAARSVQQILKNYSEIYDLPRKFKISFSACSKACAQPWINDLGFVADIHNGQISINLIGAGSLGARPATGIIIKEDIPVQDIPIWALAAVRLFNIHGNRKVRSKARLRHVRERLGDAVFLESLTREFEDCKGQDMPVTAPLTLSKRGYQLVAELNFPLGHIEPQAAEAIATLMDDDHSIIARIQNHHRIALFAKNPDSALYNIKADSRVCGFVSGPDIAACPGTAYCKHALVNTHTVENELRNRLPEVKNNSIRISGCPNGCAHSAVAHIGLAGRIKKDSSGNRVEGFHVYTGGGMGMSPVLAESHTPFVPATQIVDKILQIYV